MLGMIRISWKHCVRVVKEMRSKSIRLCPQEFEFPRCRPAAGIGVNAATRRRKKKQKKGTHTKNKDSAVSFSITKNDCSTRLVINSIGCGFLHACVVSWEFGFPAAASAGRPTETVVCIYACVHVCLMYVCVYVCTHVCLV